MQYYAVPSYVDIDLVPNSTLELVLSTDLGNFEVGIVQNSYAQTCPIARLISSHLKEPYTCTVTGTVAYIMPSLEVRLMQLQDTAPTSEETQFFIPLPREIQNWIITFDEWYYLYKANVTKSKKTTEQSLPLFKDKLYDLTTSVKIPNKCLAS